MGNNCCRKKKIRRRIALLLVGLDNAGKTKAANGLAGDVLSSPVPTVGFSVINLKYLNYDVRVFDLGGGPNIRGIWNKYFVDAHGIIFVVDSSDYSRFDEVKLVLEDLLHDDKVAGKPLLLLANKQDHENALDEIDIIEYLNIEQLVNSCKCPTLVQSCSASEKTSNKLDLGIQKGYEWILTNISKNYETLNERVENDVREQQQKDREELLEKIERIKNMQEIEETKDDDAIESYSDYERKLSANVQNNETRNSVTILDNKAVDNSDLSENSSIIFPPVYHGNVNDSALPERPKSAVQIVKHQLQLNNGVKKNSFISRSNKTAPLNLYAVNLPRSASEKRRVFSNDSRNLKSADDCLFTISNNLPNCINQMGPSGDNVSKNNFQLHSFDKFKKLPPLNTENKVPWVQKALNGDNNVVSVIDID